MSRNKNRLGSTQKDAKLPPQTVLQDTESTPPTGGLSFVVPTEFIDLPSGGRFYPEGHPLHGQECIEIKQMTAKEEDILTSRALLKKGIALDRIIESVIVNKGVNPQDLLIGDRNAIIVATRVSGYGQEYVTGVTCPNCSHSQKYAFDLNEGMVYHGEDVADLDVVDHGDGTFSTTLPRSGFEVSFRLLTGRDEKKLADLAEQTRKRKRPDRVITTQLASMIVAINGESNPATISQAIEVLPSMDSRHLRAAYKIAAPNVDLSQHFECEECGHEETMEVPLTADFFWPDR